MVSCKKTEEITAEKVVKRVPKKSEFGFVYSDFNVVHDTVEKGDTFGTLLEEQNIGNRQVYDIIAKVKVSFDVRTIRIKKPFTMLRSKNKKNDLQVFIYQPDNLCGGRAGGGGAGHGRAAGAVAGMTGIGDSLRLDEFQKIKPLFLNGFGKRPDLDAGFTGTRSGNWRSDGGRWSGFSRGGTGCRPWCPGR